MIGSFWNLCRACPSMPVDKLHSEYRSTYRWHEFKQQSQTDGAGAGIVKQPAKSPPNALPLFQGPTEPAMPRRKKYPGVAYKTNEIFDPAPTDIRPRQSAYDRARSAQRNETDRAGRRSKSEGPRQTRWTDTVEPKNTTALGDVVPVKDPEPVSLTLSTTEYRNQFAWPKDAETPRKSISMGALKKAAVAEGSTTEAEPLMNHADEHDGADKRYNEDYLWNGQKPGVQRKSTFRTALSAFISNGEDKTKDNRKKMSYKSEYKKKFRPFSQYVYEASKGTFTKCRGKGKMSEETKEASERMLAGSERVGGDAMDGPGGEDSAATLRAAGLQPLGRPEGDSWYREVLDLRKRAGEYKYRGWGTELAPEHITQLYNKQIELWHQVSRRSSLSALSLANTNHSSTLRALPKDEKDGKESKSHSPKKFRSFRSAPHQSIHAKLQENKERSQNTSPQKTRKKMGNSFDEGTAPDGAKSESFRSPRRRPRSADPAPVQTKHLPNGHEAQPRPAKPTGLALNRGSSRVRTTSQSSKGGRSPSAPPKTGARGANGTTLANGTLANGSIGATETPDRGRRSRSVSKVGIKLDNEIPSHRSASVAKDHFFDDSPVVKSPPEPTRVKSPEQMNMRSPDPVNWTVPLDTGKTFTVTQNVKSDESIKRPSSEFRGGSIAEEVRPAEIAPIHHQQMSPIRSLKKSESPTSLSKRTDKTPTTPISLTPIDETKALDMKSINGVNGVNGNGVNVNGTQLTPETPTQEPLKEKDVVKKSTEATQVAPGVVDTTVVNETTSGLTAAEVLDRARNRFDKFWGKKEEDNV